MRFEEVFRPVEVIPHRPRRENAIDGALNMLAGSGEMRVEIVNLLGLEPKTWMERCRGRGWKMTQHTETRSTKPSNDSSDDPMSSSTDRLPHTRYYIEVTK